jgi:glycosyltransferase involved in cell wall biosynthesis/1-acyl-sn-glycerol-3-phosphate acyltransferase
MRICLVTDNFDSSNNGTSTATNRLVQALISLGHEVRVVTMGDPARSGFDADLGAHMYYLPELHIPGITYLCHKQGTTMARPRTDVLTAAMKDADVVHCVQPWPLEYRATTIAKKLGIPRVASFHIQPENITYNLGLRRIPIAATFFYFLMRVLFYRRFDHIHCPSRMIAAQLRAHNYRARLHVISNGVPDEFHPAAPTKPFTDGLFHILMVGRLSPEKQQSVLIEAAARCANRDRIQLHFAGNGPRLAKLKRLAAKSGLAHTPTFGHYQPAELIDLMRACQLYVHTSEIEIEGLGCLEATACGLVPVIADSRRSASSQFALGLKSVFRNNDPDDLADKIDYWIEHPEQREQDAAEYPQAARRYSLANTAAERAVLYHKAALKQPRNVYWRGRLARFIGWLFVELIAVPLLFLWTRVVLGARVTGYRNLWKVRGAITVSNHVHLLDSALVGTALFPRKAIFTTLPQNLDRLFPGLLVHPLGGVPIPKEPSKLELFFDEMYFALRQGDLVHFFPEGQLKPFNESLQKFHRGAFELAAMARVPVVPITIRFIHPTGISRLWRRRPLIRMVISKPIMPVSLDEQRDAAERQKLVYDQMASELSADDITEAA